MSLKGTVPVLRPDCLSLEPREPGIIESVQTDDEILEDARRAGIDLDLLDTNLALSVAQRWRQHDDALELALALESARVARDAELQADTRTTE